MRSVRTAITAAVMLAGAMTAPPQARAEGGATGLWPTSFGAQQTAGDCGKWWLDKNGFCVADDTRNGLEVGVRFRTSQAVRITGLRIYRYDTANLRASLWNASGKLLARGTFAPGPASAWQDMSFPTPVTIVPGATYVASYFTPRTRYAFRYEYFARSGLTVGPITALRSTDASPNGVHCYDDAPCGSFPVRGFRSSTYWVTPLWVDAPAAAGAPAAAPRVLRVAPTGTAASVRPRISISFSRPMRRATLTTANVRLLRQHRRVAARLIYSAKHRRLVVVPRSRLRPRTEYTVVITTRVRNSSGFRLDQDPDRGGLQAGRWTFRTPG